jgi:hypothetical protein
MRLDGRTVWMVVLALVLLVLLIHALFGGAVWDKLQ